MPRALSCTCDFETKFSLASESTEWTLPKIHVLEHSSNAVDEIGAPVRRFELLRKELAAFASCFPARLRAAVAAADADAANAAGLARCDGVSRTAGESRTIPNSFQRQVLSLSCNLLCRSPGLILRHPKQWGIRDRCFTRCCRHLAPYGRVYCALRHHAAR